MSRPDLKSFPKWEPVALSPRGDRIAYCVISGRGTFRVNRLGLQDTGAPGSVGGSEVWMTELASGRSVCLTPGWGSSWRPKWSPSGRLLAFYSDRNGMPQLWLWDSERGEARLATEEPVAAFFWYESPQWSPAEDFIALKLRSEGWDPRVEELGAPEPPGRIDVWVSPRPAPTIDAGAAGKQTPWYHRSIGDVGIVDLATGNVMRLATGWVIQGLRLSPDGRRLACMQYDGVGEGLTFTLHVFDVGASGRRGGDGIGGHRIIARAVPQGYGNAFSWSPGGGRLAYTTWFESDPGELFVVDVDAGSTRVYRGNGGENLGNEDFPPIWAPDGRTVYCDNPGGAYRVDLDSGAVTDIGAGLGRTACKIIADTDGRLAGTAGTVGTAGAATCDPGSVATWTRDRNTRKEGIWRVGGASPRELLPEAYRNLEEIALVGAASGRWLIGVVEGPAEPPDLCAVDLVTGEMRTVTSINGAWRETAICEARLVGWKDRTGQNRWIACALPRSERAGRDRDRPEHGSVQAGFKAPGGTPTLAPAPAAAHVLTPDPAPASVRTPDPAAAPARTPHPAPAPVRTPVPALVHVYGGEMQSARICRFGFGNPDLIRNAVSRGWAVLFPDMPLPWDSQEPWRDITENVLLAVDAAVEQGLVDGGRLGLYGHSYGGYCVNVIVSRTNRFKAAVSAAGFSDLLRHALSMPFRGSLSYMEWTAGDGRMRDLPWENPQRYIENSPVFRAHAVETPLLLLHGTEDTAVPVEQSEAMFAALYRLNKEAVLVRYGGEGHVMDAPLSPYRDDYWNRVLAWFEERLAR